MDNEKLGGRLNGMNWNILDRRGPLSSANVRLAAIQGDQRRSIGVLTTHQPDSTIHGDYACRHISKAQAHSRSDLVREINAKVVSQARLYVYSSDRTQDQFISNRMSSNMQAPPFFPSLVRGPPN